MSSYVVHDYFEDFFVLLVTLQSLKFTWVCPEMIYSFVSVRRNLIWEEKQEEVVGKDESPLAHLFHEFAQLNLVVFLLKSKLVNLLIGEAWDWLGLLSETLVDLEELKESAI
jgi:hypothetical protein